jgi:hypothetical protein
MSKHDIILRERAEEENRVLVLLRNFQSSANLKSNF